MNPLASSVLLGTATGLRSQAGLAAVLALTPRQRLPGISRSTVVRRVSIAAAVAESAVDKLPVAGERTRPAPLLLRVALGAVASGLFASSLPGAAVVPAAVAGGLAASGAAFAGLQARLALADRLGALRAAVTEDLLALGLAAGTVAATRR